jgi:lipopolysaccharide biosynthesis regulator YciM
MSAGDLIKRGNQLQREGKLEEAISAYQSVIAQNPYFLSKKIDA